MFKRTLFVLFVAMGTLAFAAGAQAAYLTLGTGNTSNATTTLSGNPAGAELLVKNTNGASANAFGVYGLLTATSPTATAAGVRGTNSSTNGYGFGVYGSQAGSGTGVRGFAPSGKGVFGSSTSGTGVYGLHSSTSGVQAGVSGATSSSAPAGAGVSGTAASATGVLGSSATADRPAAGVVGRNSAVLGVGVLGCANYGADYSYHCSHGGNAGGTGGLFVGAAVNGYPNGEGVVAWGGGAYGIGVRAHGNLYGVLAYSSASDAVYGQSSSGPGVHGYSPGNDGVVGVSASSTHAGVAGSNSYGGNGVYGERVGDVGYAGYFVGPVHVQGTLSKTAGSFRIDHPLDPAHRYLQHSFVESPDMLNVYNGNVTTNKRGFATVKLPRYFQALNRSFRYQLTPLGRRGWDARAGIWRKIRNSRFTIRTDKPRVEVSWQVTGVRHDRYANANRIQVVVPKAKKEQGKYLHPELYGKPKSQAIGYQKPHRLPRRATQKR
jgi:hypothetical protein